MASPAPSSRHRDARSPHHPGRPAPRNGLVHPVATANGPAGPWLISNDRQSMKELQQSVAQFVERHRLEADVAHRLLDAVSELGEVAKEALKGSSYGSAKFAATSAWKEELGDVIFSLMCVANTTGVDLDEAVRFALAKYEARIEQDGAPDSRRKKSRASRNEKA